MAHLRWSMMHTDDDAKSILPMQPSAARNLSSNTWFGDLGKLLCVRFAHVQACTEKFWIFRFARVLPRKWEARSILPVCVCKRCQISWQLNVTSLRLLEFITTRLHATYQTCSIMPNLARQRFEYFLNIDFLGKLVSRSSIILPNE